jgi:hypothetical protein
MSKRDFDGGSITAKHLQYKKFNNAFVNDAVRQILLRIDEIIKDAYAANDNIVHFSAPTTFAFPSMKNADAQLVVYYRILRSLTTRGFDVHIALNKTETIFTISWRSDFDETERQTMYELIKSHQT